MWYSDGGCVLTSYLTSSAYSVEYDAVGNPTSITKDGTRYILGWQGRQLTGLGTVISGSAWSAYVSFTYNADGIRTGKQYFNVTHEYMLNGSQIIGETWTDGEGDEYMLIYLYDENGSPIGMKYRTQYYAEGVFDCYFFEKNLQGDIVAVYNDEGAMIGAYAYDAWGNVKVTYGTNNYIVTRLNPFRYRGYYYDVETGFYYLQSRYYNPAWGRFLNADGYVSTGQGLLGTNMFTYCNNNPIMGYDPCGTCIHRLDFWNDCEKCGGANFDQKLQAADEWIFQNIEKPIKKTIVETTFNIIDFVDPDNNINSIQFGKSFSAGCGGDISLSWGIAFDRSGNFGNYFTLGLGGSAGCGVSASRTFTTSDAPSIENLSGGSFNMGGSVVVIAGGGYEYGKCIGNPYSTNTYSIAAGVGWPAEFHAQLTHTFLIRNRNVYN